MSQELQKISDEMVFEGVTAKEQSMKRVKAIQKLWKSDSFEVMKSILEEEPIQEGKFRIKVGPGDVDHVEKPTTSQSAFENQKTGRLIAKMKLDLKTKYESVLKNDLEVLKNRVDEMMKTILDQTREMFEASETGQLEDTIKQKLETMRRNIKCFKKQKKKEMKLAVQLNLEKVIAEINEYTETVVDARLKTFRKLLEKLYDFQIRRLTESLTDEYQNNIDQWIRLSIVKFNLAKEKLLKKHKDELQRLKCNLENKLNDYQTNSANRKDTLLKHYIQEIDNRSVKFPGEDESITGVVQKMLARLQDECLLPKDLTPDENWEAIVYEVVERFQMFIELVLGRHDIKQNQYLLSMEKLIDYKNKISELNMKRLIDTKQTRRARTNRLKSRAASVKILEHIIRYIIPSKESLHYSFNELHLTRDCSDAEISSYSETNRAMDLEGKQSEVQSIDLNYCDESYSLEKVEYSDTDSYEVQDFVKTCRNETKLFNLFFYGI